jgi:hypothetical protein
MNKFYILIVVLFISSKTYSQNKKEQILDLKNKIDSLSFIISKKSYLISSLQNEKDNLIDINTKLKSELNNRNDSIKYFKSVIYKLNNQVENLHLLSDSLTLIIKIKNDSLDNNFYNIFWQIKKLEVIKETEEIKYLISLYLNNKEVIKYYEYLSESLFGDEENGNNIWNIYSNKFSFVNIDTKYEYSFFLNKEDKIIVQYKINNWSELEGKYLSSDPLWKRFYSLDKNNLWKEVKCEGGDCLNIKQ